MRPEVVRWVKIVVLKTLREKRLNNLDVDNLISCGLDGYSQALRRFDPTRGVKFKTFAEYRIKGAVLDEVRKLIGDERCKTKRPRQVEIEDFGIFGDDGIAMRMMESSLDVEYLFNAMPLDEKSRDILRLRIEGHNLKDIGVKYGLSESRISQMFLGIKAQILPWFREYMDRNFTVITHNCPSCGHPNGMFRVEDFECENCGSDIGFVEGTPVLKIEV